VFFEKSIVFMNRLIIYLLEGSKLYLPVFQFFCEHPFLHLFLGTLARDVAVIITHPLIFATRCERRGASGPVAFEEGLPPSQGGGVQFRVRGAGRRVQPHISRAVNLARAVTRADEKGLLSFFAEPTANESSLANRGNCNNKLENNLFSQHVVNQQNILGTIC
jgi:hypothetical protein